MCVRVSIVFVKNWHLKLKHSVDNDNRKRSENNKTKQNKIGNNRTTLAYNQMCKYEI